MSALVSMAVSPFTADAQVTDPDILSRSLVFQVGENGSKSYRIPAVVTCDDGTLVAVADRRIENSSDLPGKIDVVCRTWVRQRPHMDPYGDGGCP